MLQPGMCSASVSDSHSRRNTNQSAETAITAMAALIRKALAVGLRVQGGLQCVFGCVYEGAVDADRVVAMIDGGIDSITARGGR